MKRLIVATLALCILVVFMPLSVFAESTVSYVTSFDYSQIRTGGIDGTLVYGSYDDNGNYMIGTMDETGELTREVYSPARFNALFAPREWTTEVKGDASSLCPYASKHKANTVCPYLNVQLVNMTNNATGAVFSDVYVEDTSVNLLPGGSFHYCFGNYVYESPVTLKWDGKSRFMSLCNADGLWGVYDIDRDVMVKQYLYRDMSAVYGTLAKVYNGTAWGRLDLESVSPPEFVFETQDDFYVTAEAVRQADGTFLVYNADGDVLSVAFSADFTDVTYIADAKAVLCTAGDNTKTLCDLSGTCLMTFAADEEVTHLQDDCFAVTKYTKNGAVDGVALLVADGLVYPEGLVVAGDVDLNGEVDTNDARLVLRYLVRMQPLTELQRLAADYSGDGVVRARDVRLMLMDMTEEAGR